MKIVLSVMGLVALVFIAVFAIALPRWNRDQQVVGIWEDYGSEKVLDIRSNHVAIEGYKGLTPSHVANWSWTNNGIVFDSDINIETNGSTNSYTAEVRHDGKILRLTSERGNVLVFQRINN